MIDYKPWRAQEEIFRTFSEGIKRQLLFLFMSLGVNEASIPYGHLKKFMSQRFCFISHS